MRTITCLCEKRFDVELPEQVDLDANVDQVSKILDGSFFTVTCPSCGNLLKPELPVRITSARWNTDVFVVPEQERIDFYEGRVTVPGGAEVLVGYDELVERIGLLAEGVDPVASEIVKYFLLGKAAEAAPDADITVRFHGREEKSLVFYIIGIKADEAGVVKLPLATFQDMTKDVKGHLSRAPFDAIFAGVYRSVRALEMLKDEAD